MNPTPGPACSIQRYNPARKAEWDAFVRRSKNGTFLFARDYMDYHQDRFQDHSLMVQQGNALVALLPANRVDDELHSHGGLTYGGLVVDETMTTPAMLDVFEALLAYLRYAGFVRLHYKTVPSIYHRIPAEEDRYALFRVGAALSRRDTLSVIPQGRRGPVQARRRRAITKAAREGLRVEEAADWGPYWTMLSAHLSSRYGVNPVHSLEQIELLRSRFPAEIRLFEARSADEVVGGVVVFASPIVAHAQYIAASERGRAVGALDALFEYLIGTVFAASPWFDFGISNEDEGRRLNRGLVEQKEGFGARCVVHDFYTINLE